MSAAVRFDPAEPLAEGITVLEASAGTGKTHAVAELVAREVAAGHPLDELLVVTFTRKATGTLRDRVRRMLARRRDEATAAGDHEGRRHLEHALATYDAATITTTHGFCQEVLASVGVAGGADRDLVLVEHVTDLVDDAVDDLLLGRRTSGRSPTLAQDTARTIARQVVDHPAYEIAPVDDTPADRLRRNFALAVRRRVEDEKQRRRLFTYDDLLLRLADALVDPVRGPLVVDRLRRRFRTVIVDEFQDTDAKQWQILEQAFAAPPNRLVLVGDPKQAIYAFRGGDVHTYLAATERAAQRRVLDQSWRSGPELLAAFDAFFGRCRLGDRSIRVEPVTAHPDAGAPAVADAPLTVRVLPGDPSAPMRKDRARALVAADVAAEAVRILSSGERIGTEPVGPGDLAVLVRATAFAEQVRGALVAAGIPAVVHGATNVLQADAAADWLHLLRALERPSTASLVHRAAIGPFFGWDGLRLVTATDGEREAVDGSLHEWAAILRTRGVAAVLAAAETGTGGVGSGLSARLLATQGGERLLGDLRHLAELLQARQVAYPSTAGALAAWLEEQIAEARRTGEDATRRRLETDAGAVSIHTVHGAKGLEFPIVLLPSVWDAVHERDDDLPVFHEDGTRWIAVGRGGSDPDDPDAPSLRGEQARRARVERDEEDLRLLYVAMTRAQHRVVAWWAGATGAHRTAFARILLATDADGTVALQADPRRALDSTVMAGELRTRGLHVVEVVGEAAGSVARSAPPAGGLAVAPFGRSFDRRWVRTSYSGLTAAAHDVAPIDADLDELLGPVGPVEPVEVDDPTKVDEPAVAPAAVPPSEGPLAAPLPLGSLPGGTRVGTLVHELLEHTDFTAADLAGAVADAAVAHGADRILEGRVDELVDGLVLALETPLGPGWDGRRLRDLRRVDRLDELGFDLPLAGGDHPTERLLTMAAIADVFAGLPADDPLAGYHERLADPRLAASVRGFLNGSIDLVARVGERYLVVDYKTNLLAPPGVAPTAWHYRPEAMAEAMAVAHYPLQAALYAVALHRFLRWRLPGYSPEAHLGGVGYLFLRGMSGPDTPVVDGAPCGVFGWFPPASFVIELSDLLDRGVA